MRVVDERRGRAVVQEERIRRRGRRDGELVGGAGCQVAVVEQPDDDRPAVGGVESECAAAGDCQPADGGLGRGGPVQIDGQDRAGAVQPPDQINGIDVQGTRRIRRAAAADGSALPTNSCPVTVPSPWRVLPVRISHGALLTATVLPAFTVTTLPLFRTVAFGFVMVRFAVVLEFTPTLIAPPNARLPLAAWTTWFPTKVSGALIVWVFVE